MKKKRLKNNFDIEILGYTFNVSVTEDLLISQGNVCQGLANPSEHWIKIDSKLDYQQQQQTLSHEILHCIDWLMNNEQFTLSEEVINKLATGLVTVKKL